MKRRLFFDIVFLAALSWGLIMAIAIGVAAVSSWGVWQPVALGACLAVLGAGIGVFALSRSSRRRLWLFFAALAVSASCSLLLVKLLTVLAELHPGGEYAAVNELTSLVLPAVALMAALAMALGSPATPAAADLTSGSETASRRPAVSIDQVLLTDPNLVCPIDKTRPRHYNHVMIKCPKPGCSGLFCSRHLKEMQYRCYKCRTPIPFLQEIESYIKKLQ